jgi:molybdopterin-guanine dinucleotide biosynthesis protein B
MSKRLAVAFTGPSNSGKTTLIVKIADHLIQNEQQEVSIIKNDPKDKARFDVEGKDSDKFTKTGADVVVTSPTRTTLFSQHTMQLKEMIKLFPSFDFLLVEGLKTLPLPRIAIFRNELDPNYFDYIEAIAIDDSITDRSIIPEHIQILDLNDTLMIIEWIKNHAKEV